MESNRAVVWKGHGSAVLDCVVRNQQLRDIWWSGGVGALATRSGGREIASGHVPLGISGYCSSQRVGADDLEVGV